MLISIRFRAIVHCLHLAPRPRFQRFLAEEGNLFQLKAIKFARLETRGFRGKTNCSWLGETFIHQPYLVTAEVWTRVVFISRCSHRDHHLGTRVSVLTSERSWSPWAWPSARWCLNFLLGVFLLGLGKSLPIRQGLSNLRPSKDDVFRK